MSAAKPAAPEPNEGRPWSPLAQRLRPRNLDELIGQKHLLGPGKLLRRLYELGQTASLILWGPPGVGKTSLARLLTDRAKAEFVEFSAVLSGIKDVREVVAQAQTRRRLGGRPTVLFVDEIHRFNKAQQDAFLPHVENGLITLIGATTENPSFEIIPALISRASVLTLEPLSRDELADLITLALTDRERGLGALEARLAPEALDFLVVSSGGDARALLNALELSAGLVRPDADGRRTVDLAAAEEAVQRKAWRYDKGAEEHYNLISALHKSLRDSDPDAALYWLARMLDGGEDPVYLLRRMIRFASEDVGLADPLSLLLGISALESYRLLGSPEGELALAHLAVHLALAPKSNSVYKAFGAAQQDVRRHGPLPVPLNIRNAPTKLMKDLGYGRGYQYAHDHPDALTDQPRLPDELRERRYYWPTRRGREKALAEHLDARREALRRRRERPEGRPGGWPPEERPAGWPPEERPEDRPAGRPEERED
ncbi:MAG: replication-associated recombination protein A [Deltaproteobacteria bacterium]|jgi:putative ATPase|nr:replication-associated recombination protein A [Deltaproteobacteria bacterium]